MGAFRWRGKARAPPFTRGKMKPLEHVPPQSLAEAAPGPPPTGPNPPRYPRARPRWLSLGTISTPWLLPAHSGCSPSIRLPPLLIGCTTPRAFPFPRALANREARLARMDIVVGLSA